MLQAPTVSKPASVETYDLVVIGAGPMGLVEASVAAREKKKVCLIEAGPALGGAWGVGRAFDVDGVELSPHVFMPDQTAYDVLRCFLPSDYETLPTSLQPEVMIRSGKKFGNFYRVKMSDRFREMFAYFWATIAEAKNDEATARKKFLKDAEYRIENNQLCDIIYPRHGLVRWLDDIKRHLVASGVTIKTNTRVTHIAMRSSAKKDRALVFPVDNNGTEYRSRQIAYTELMHADRFSLDADDIDIGYEHDYSSHVLFIVSGVPAGTALPFLRIRNDSWFMFFNDVTRYSPDFQSRYPGMRLINTRLSPTRLFIPSQAKRYFNHLTFVEWLPKSAAMEDFHHVRHRRQRIASNDHAALRRLWDDEQMMELVSGHVGLHNGLRKGYGRHVSAAEAKKPLATTLTALLTDFG